jgi:hypothetical protein
MENDQEMLLLLAVIACILCPPLIFVFMGIEIIKMASEEKTNG